MTLKAKLIPNQHSDETFCEDGPRSCALVLGFWSCSLVWAVGCGSMTYVLGCGLWAVGAGLLGAHKYFREPEPH
jgi:hypothetical protein